MKTLLFAAALLAAPTMAQAAEHLVLPPYPGPVPWKIITDKANAVQTMKEWNPANQNESAIKDILTENVFRNLKGNDPAAFLTGWLGSVAKACTRVRTNGPKASMENGYRVAYAQAYCSNQIGANLDVDIFAKAIWGHDGLYVVQREFHRPAAAGGVPGVADFSKNQMGEMTARLKAQTAANDFLVKQVTLKP
jgi:hypothetical protein